MPAQRLPRILTPGHPKTGKILQVLPKVSSILLIILCSYTLSQITWLLIPGDETPSAPPAQRKPVSNTPLQPQDYRQIKEAQLFGLFEKTAAPAVTTDAPDTRLNLVLKGLLAATPMKNAVAIISLGKNGKEDNYSVGDKVSSARIREIHTDRVILERSGKLETLRLPEDSKDDFIKAAPKTEANRSTSSSPGAVLSDIRKKIMKNPTSFGQYAIPVPYNENGQLKGYRLQPRGDRSLFESVGLETNDVIISVNGVELNNPTSGLKAIRSLQSAKQLDLIVLRNGSEVPLHFEIP